MRFAVLARRGLALSVACAACAGVAGCGSSDDGSTVTSGTAAASGTTTDPSKPVNIAYFDGAKANTYLQATLDGIEETAKKEGATVQVFDAAFDPSKQVSQVQDALASGKYQAFIVSALDGTSLVPSLQDAITKGIPVATTVNPVGPDPGTNAAQIDGETVSVMTPPQRHGELIGQLTIDACADRDPCEVAYLLGASNVSFEKVKEEAFKDVIAKAPNVKLVATQVGGYLPDPSRQATQDLLQAHPDLAVVATDGDQMANGAAQAAKEAGKKVLVIGQGGSSAAVTGLKDGSWFGSAMQLPKTEGVIAAQSVIAAARGQKVAENAVDPVAKAGFETGTLTKDNVDRFTPEWAG